MNLDNLHYDGRFTNLRKFLHENGLKPLNNNHQKNENDWFYPIERLKILLNLDVKNKKLNYDYS